MKFILKLHISLALILTTPLIIDPAFGQTKVKIKIPTKIAAIDPMIYGQMLENVNDSMIYGGLLDLLGKERLHVTNILKPLNVPVMRWPGGTVVHEYHWKEGIGPIDQRRAVRTFAWNGIESYKFGTDEFLQWCKKIGTEPYINFNMGTHPDFKGTLHEALDWIEYVNGKANTKYGKLRVSNGHEKPYQVKYWGIGNENYESWGKHFKETDSAYADRLYQWSSAIKHKYPELKLMGVGHSYEWDKTILERCGTQIDYLTQHYYVVSKVSDNSIEDPLSSLFAPLKMEVHIKKLGKLLDEVNARSGRIDNPVKLSIDEWNNRHSVNKNDKYEFTRQDPRRQFDVAITAGMLNAFIRTSPTVGMANYIFPVNAHGLIRTVGNKDAFFSALYPIFYQYRKWMIGSKIDVNVKGNGVLSSKFKITLDGDANESELEAEEICYTDASGVINDSNTITIALVNRNPNQSEKIEIQLPENYKAVRKWTLENNNLNAHNSNEIRNEIQPKETLIKQKSKVYKTTISSCGLQLIQLERVTK